MKKSEVKIGGLYRATVSDKVVTVRIDNSHSKGGWTATNTSTGKRIRIKSAQRLRGPAESHQEPVEATEPDVNANATVAAQVDGASKKAEPKKSGSKQKPKHMSALDAASQVLAKSDRPMRAKDLIAAMAEQGLWSSPKGKTPHSTLYAAMLRESRDKGAASRFKRVDRGQFTFIEESKQ